MIFPFKDVGCEILNWYHMKKFEALASRIFGKLDMPVAKYESRDTTIVYSFYDGTILKFSVEEIQDMAESIKNIDIKTKE